MATAFGHLGEFGNGEEWRFVLNTTLERYEELEAHLIAAHALADSTTSTMFIDRSG
ncbi:hypothetical protein NE236_30580 [Actinoallomurus purpureus]|uniref:hypothetical protein n=1 Tax=Actinoallomurus purpureus TaxID=478114 RepID=UPI002092F523|nr:hypothetical protein [Actinoallomurus purpureus]MCO6009326.1 hypothetical protein [Actinoallomurus purpureus]